MNKESYNKGSAMSTSNKLKEAKELLEMGLITKEDFDTIKAEVLGELRGEKTPTPSPPKSKNKPKRTLSKRISKVTVSPRSFGSGDNQIDMMVIPAGTFMMGDTEGGSELKPLHKVTLTRNFMLGKYPVTQRLWVRIMKSNPSHFKGDDHPVETLTWYDSVLFCNKLSEKEGLEKAYTIQGKEVQCNFDSKGYRLPTEAEWEYCAKANQNFTYSGSDNPNEVAWTKDNSIGKTHPVGHKKANGFGLYDMNGNVSEWVWDGQRKYNDQPVENPVYDGTLKVLRGGHWESRAKFRGVTLLRISSRNNVSPSYKCEHWGFRLARTIT